VDLYEKLQHAVLPAYYDARSIWTRIMQQTIALNASFFNAHRMAQQYAAHACTLSPAGRPSGTTGE
jgi:starch phosphorylase